MPRARQESGYMKLIPPECFYLWLGLIVDCLEWFYRIEWAWLGMRGSIQGGRLSTTDVMFDAIMSIHIALGQ